jgi:DNA mismatch repair protein MutS2
MTSRSPIAVRPGDAVQTPLGKGVVREVRNNGRLLVELKGRAVEVAATSVTRLDTGRRATSGTTGRRSRESTPTGASPPTPAARPISDPRARAVRAEVDLHGLTVTEALARAEDALNEALLADLPELRLVHGRRGGRIRAALHRHLSQIASVRAFRVDPRNPGATIVTL